MLQLFECYEAHFTILLPACFYLRASVCTKSNLIKLDATINPATADFIHRAIEVAQKERVTCLLIHLNTPGGLLQSTRIIVSDILESPVPVVVYV